MARKGGREFKNDMKHLRSSMAPNILVLNIGFGQRYWRWAYTQNVEDPPHGCMFEGSAAKGSKKPNEFKEAITDLAKVIANRCDAEGSQDTPIKEQPNEAS